MSELDAWMDALPEPTRQWLDGRRVDEVECVVADMAGTARGKAMPVRKFSQGEDMYLPTSIFLQTITGEYAQPQDAPYFGIESDLILRPDLSTATAVPWSKDVTLQIVHEALLQDGTPAPLSPRNVLKRVLSEYEREGWQPIVAPEIEFYLTKPNIDPNHPVEPPIGRTGRQGQALQAYSMSAVEEYGKVIDDIYDFAEAQGFEIDTIMQESGPGQVEINLKHGDPVALADQVFYYKRLIREAALKNDCFATFMAKPMEQQPGSAMHIHQSVISIENGKNIFNTASGEPSQLFEGFLAGQQSHLPSVFCMLAPYVNSYRRFARDDAAPINLEWGFDNRTVGLRIPLSSPENRRIENRISGMDCNPYLAIAASLGSGLLGMLAKTSPRQEINSDAYALPFELPRSLLEALDLFSENAAVRDLLGAEFCTAYQSIKQNEIEAYSRVISPWERQHLLLNV